jgi:response regulator of citrate/malate metabolism
MPVKVVVVVEDDPDVQFLVETIFSMDCRFTFGGVAASAKEALEQCGFDSRHPLHTRKTLPHR